MEDKEIREMIMLKQVDHRISCKTAMEIAQETGTPARKIGQLIDEMGIKIRSCQLGCFK